MMITNDKLIILPLSGKRFKITYKQLSRWRWEYQITPVNEAGELIGESICGKAFNKKQAIMKVDIWLTKNMV